MVAVAFLAGFVLLFFDEFCYSFLFEDLVVSVGEFAIEIFFEELEVAINHLRIKVKLQKLRQTLKKRLSRRNNIIHLDFLILQLSLHQTSNLIQPLRLGVYIPI